MKSKISNLLSKKDIICLLEIINESLSCAKEEDFRKLMKKINVLIPYDFAVSGIGKFDNNSNINSYDIVNISYPVEWLTLYTAKGYHQIDPIVKMNSVGLKLQYWEDTYKIISFPRHFLSQARDFELEKGYTHGVRSSIKREESLFSFAGNSVEHHPRTEIILNHLVSHLHETLTRILDSRPKKQNMVISLREKEVLDWVKQGKTSWDISNILHIAERTVNFHIKNILEKLDVVNRIQAVAVAIQYGLIEME